MRLYSLTEQQMAKVIKAAAIAYVRQALEFMMERQLIYQIGYIKCNQQSIQQQFILIKHLILFAKHITKDTMSQLKKSTRHHYQNTNYQTYHTERLNTKSSNLSSASQPLTTRYRTQYHHDSYLELAINKTKNYFGKSYLQMKKQNNNSEMNSQNKQIQQNKNMIKIYAFKNLHQFQKSIQTKKKLISSSSEVSLKSFGIATFKGINKSINSHQISVHISSTTSVFTLFQGYDGILSAITLKKKYLNIFLQNLRKRRSSNRQQSFKIVEETIKKAFSLSQQQLSKLQNEFGDNSGSSILSVVVHNGIVFAANCGQSAILCCTSKNNILQLAVPHTTDNQSQIQRIIKAGGRLYQTVINIPYKINMNIKGPLRIAPTGLKFTRTMGKNIKQAKNSNAKLPNNGILNAPEIQYLPQDQIRWLLILSSKLYESLNKHRISDIIQQQLIKRTQSYGNDDAAEHVCKRILLEGVQLGVEESASVAILIFTPYKCQQKNEKPQEKQTQWKKLQSPQKSTISFQKRPRISSDRSFLMPEKKQKSLKYIGNRSNFVQEIHSNSYFG